MRHFIKSGLLNKVTNANNKLQKYRFFLFSDVLIYAEGGLASKNKVPQSPSRYPTTTTATKIPTPHPSRPQSSKSHFKMHLALHLGLCRIVDLQPPRNSKTSTLFDHSFRIVSPQKTFVVSCADAKVRRLP